MQTFFTLPTYRIKHINDTLKSYTDNFKKYGHTDHSIIIFDDSMPELAAKYNEGIDSSYFSNPLFYVGAKEKEEFKILIKTKLKDKISDLEIHQIFRSSYGGNRNFTALYTLNGLMISSDDDMRPYGYIDRKQNLNNLEICKGHLVKKEKFHGVSKVNFDFFGKFLEVLGKKERDIPKQYVRGDYVVDSAMDLSTNASNGLEESNTLSVIPGSIKPDQKVAMALTYRTGTADIDAVDFIQMIINDSSYNDFDELRDFYVIDDLRPAITNKNYRMDCGVAGYDNSVGIPPFIPSFLRFEDYLYRLWVQQDGILGAHIDAIQHHLKNNYMRFNHAFEVYNEEITNLIKRNINKSSWKADQNNVQFDYDGSISWHESQEIFEKIQNLNSEISSIISKETNETRKHQFLKIKIGLSEYFNNFDNEVFYHQLSKVVRQEVLGLKTTTKLWPNLIEEISSVRSKLPMKIIPKSNKVAA